MQPGGGKSGAAISCTGGDLVGKTLGDPVGVAAVPRVRLLDSQRYPRQHAGHRGVCAYYGAVVSHGLITARGGFAGTRVARGGFHAGIGLSSSQRGLCRTGQAAIGEGEANQGLLDFIHLLARFIGKLLLHLAGDRRYQPAQQQANDHQHHRHFHEGETGITLVGQHGVTVRSGLMQ